MNITLLTRTQKKMLFLFLSAAAVLIMITIMRYNSFLKQEKNSQIQNELNVCRSWNHNLKNLKIRCEAAAEKAAYSSGGHQDFPVYAEKANACRMEFTQLKNAFLERIAVNPDAVFYYRTAELSVSWNSVAQTGVTEEKEKSGVKSEADRLVEFVKLSGSEGRNMLQKLNTCRAENTELMLSAQMYEGQSAAGDKTI